MSTELTQVQKNIFDLQKLLESAPAVTTDMREFTEHFFAPGIYVRTLFIPKGYVLVGEIHREETINILLMGKLSVVTSDGDEIIAGAPLIFKAKPGKKAGYAIEDSWYLTIHPNKNDITDIKQLEGHITVPNYEALENLT